MIFRNGPFFYTFFNLRLAITLLFKRRPDLIISNDLDTLPACSLASGIRKITLLYDSHELFTEVPELIERKFIQGIWLAIEGRLLPGLKHAITVSPSIADYYRQRYGVEFRVVRNLPVFREPDHAAGSRKEKVIIYQGALNVSRGIELMIKGMNFLEDVKLLVVGTGDIEIKLKNMASEEGLSGRVQFTGRVHPEELSALTCRASLGLSLEEDRGLNYRFSLPNKIFDYIQCRIPVLVSDLPEMGTMVRNNGVGMVLEERTPEGFAAAVTRMIADGERGVYDAALEKTSAEFCWEKEKEVYLSVLNECDILNNSV
jgi:glycosyltransferase involved in cell wall biosynthesis